MTKHAAFEWPALTLSEWEPTLDTLHLYSQIPGKIRLGLAPPEPEWGHAALFVTATGLSTGPMRFDARIFQIDLDLVEHRLLVVTSEGARESVPLDGRPVSRFYADVMTALRKLSLPVEINTMPQEVPNPIPFERDDEHHSYERPSVERFWRVLRQVDAVFKQYRADYRGRHTPVNFWWGSFDLSYARFSGKPATPPPGLNKLMRLSMDAEEVQAGFWPGDQRFPEPAFFAYVYPKPDGLERAKVQPEGASWAELGEFMLRYEDVRRAQDPEAAILQFLQSTFETCVVAAKWSRT